jgi:hypothetical protein
MNRNVKLALLSKLMQGKATEGIKQQLRESQENEAIIGIFKPGKENPDDEIIIQEKGKENRILYKELDQYAWRRGNPAIFLLPDNQRQ